MAVGEWWTGEGRNKTTTNDETMLLEMLINNINGMTKDFLEFVKTRPQACYVWERMITTTKQIVKQFLINNNGVNA